MLTGAQDVAIRQLIIDKTPDRLKMAYAQLARKAVQRLIVQKVGVGLAIRTVGNCLKRWGMTPQKPQKCAHEQQAPEAAWLGTPPPAIQARAQQEEVEIYWGDETGLRNDRQHDRGYVPKGKTSVIRLNAKCKVYLILDNLRVHYAKPVKECLEQHKKMIQVFYLTAYSPELNPDKYLTAIWRQA